MSSPKLIGYLFTTTGRVGRAEYFLISTAYSIGAYALGTAVTVLFGEDSSWTGLAGISSLLFCNWFGLTLAAKRLHDVNHSAWFGSIYLIFPAVALFGNSLPKNVTGIALLIALVFAGLLLIAAGTKGPNAYGMCEDHSLFSKTGSASAHEPKAE